MFVTTAINVIVTVIGWRRQKTKSGLFFALGMTGTTLWTLASGLGYAAVPLDLKILFAKLDAVGYNSAIVLFFFTALYVAGLEDLADNKILRGITFSLPITNVILILTNEFHGWVWREFTPVGNNIVVFQHGPGFVWIASTGYLIIALMIFTLWRATRRGPLISRTQARLLLYATLIPIAANIVYLYGIQGAEGVDWSSVTFLITGIIFLYALYSQNLMDITPIARDRLMNNMSDGMIVLDAQQRIIDANQKAHKMLNTKILGKELREVEVLEKLLDRRLNDKQQRTEIVLGDTINLYYDVLISPLHDKAMGFIGHLILFHDITVRKNDELRLLQLTKTVEQSPSAIIITNKKGLITYANPQFTQLTGYTNEEVLGKNPRFLQSGQTPKEVYQELWDAILAGQNWRGEFLNKKKNGELYWEFEVIAPVKDEDGNVVNFVAIKEDITERKNAESDLTNRLDEIQMLNKELEETQEQLVAQQRTLAAVDERRRLARNMHDSVNQSIHGLMLYSETLIDMLNKNQAETAIWVAEKIQESGRQALKEIRLMLFETNPQRIDESTDLVEAIKERLKMVESRVGVQTEVIYDEIDMVDLHVLMKENLYWMTIEALNNSLKHAHPKQIKIIFKGTNSEFTMEVVDNGAGFDVDTARTGGFGMRSMRERAEVMGGKFSVESEPGNGTRVIFQTGTGGEHETNQDTDR